MSQTKQSQKAKLYRALKILFYTLGLPLFFFAVICTAIKFIGEDPFVGMANVSLNTNVFEGYERFITSPALYGIWCALAVWVFIVICHAIVSKTMKKNFRLRLFTMIAIVLVVMLGTMGIMDAAFTSDINKIAANAPDGVTVQDYKSQLSYYDYVSFYRKDKSLTYDLMDRVNRFETAYHIEYQGINKSGEAGNISNKPVTYGRLLDEKGEAYSGTETNLEKLVTVAPNKAGKLVVEGKEYPNYYYVSRKAGNGTEVTVWYDLDLVPLGYKWKAKQGKMQFNTTNGVYGEGLYNENGLLADGWIFSFENMLEILDDLYEGQAYLDGADVGVVSSLKAEAETLRDEYYKGTKEINGAKASDRLQALYTQEAVREGDFSMTEGEIDALYSAIGELLGNNSLFDWLFGPDGKGLLNSLDNVLKNPALANLGDKLQEGVKLGDLLGAFGQEKLVGQVLGIVNALFSRNDITDLVIKLTYEDNLNIEIFANEAGGEKLLGLNLTSEISLDNLSAFLNEKLNALVENLNIEELLGSISGLAFEDMTIDGKTYKGIVVSGIAIPLLNEEGKFEIDVRAILYNLLQTLYSHRSVVIKPVWEFYEAAAKASSTDSYKKKTLAPYLANYERAYYEATVHGALIGSVLYGDTIGTGAYGSGAGLTDLASVRQLKTDLSYQPGNFPLYSFRDMLLISTGIVVCFYLLYMIMAEKEKRCAAMCAQTATDGDDDTADDLAAEDAKKPNKFVMSVKTAMAKMSRGVDNVCEKASASAAKTAENFKKRTNWDDKKTAKTSKILAIVLYVVAFLPVVLVPLVLGAMSCHLLPSYTLMHFIGFIVALVFAGIFALVICLLHRKKSKHGAKGAFARGWRIGLTYICLTAVFALLLTYFLPDLVAKGTSNTLWAEDMYYNSIQQVEENAALEHQFIIYNLLNGNLNRYETDSYGNVVLAENGDFSYDALTKRKNDKVFDIPEFDDIFWADIVSADGGDYKLDEFNKMIAGLDPLKAEMYNFVYQYYVLNDFYYAFKVTDGNKVDRRCVALAITDYLYKYADYENLAKKGFKNAKLKQLFDDNYDSFNQDGYQTFDDPLLLYAQMDGRMTVPVIIRLILNKGWSYSQPDADGKYQEAGNFLYELYDPDTYDAYVAGGGTFDKEGELINGDGRKYSVKYGYNDQGWMVYENKIVRRPVNWLVLDMLGDPMELASIQLPEDINLGLTLNLGNMLNTLGTSGVFDKGLGELLNKDLPEFVGKLTGGAGLRVGAYIDDDLQLKLQLLPMNSYFGMLGYMQATWVQSNGLIMAIINLESMRNGLLIMSGIGLVLILLAGLLTESGKKAEERLAAQTASAETTEGEAQPATESEPAEAEPATEPEQAETEPAEAPAEE